MLISIKYADNHFTSAVSGTERLVLFSTWFLLDLLGVVMLSTFEYEQRLLSQLRKCNTFPAFDSTDPRYVVVDTHP